MENDKSNLETVIEEITIILDDKKVVIGMSSLAFFDNPFIYERTYDMDRILIENNVKQSDNPYKDFYTLAKSYVEKLKALPKVKKYE